MNTIKWRLVGHYGWVPALAVLGTLTSCVDGPPRQAVYVEPPPVYAQAEPVIQDDYVYYPGYQVYFSSSRHQYFYREGRSWVSRPTPAHVSVNVLLGSPSVRMNFHDSPAAHHEAVMRQYPRRWTPPNGNSNHGQERHDDGRARDRDDRR